MPTLKQNLRAFVTDKNDKIVIAQAPNVPIIGWFLLLLASYLVNIQPWHNVLLFFSAAFLFTWAYLELTQGIVYCIGGNGPFRVRQRRQNKAPCAGAGFSHVKQGNAGLASLASSLRALLCTAICVVAPLGRRITTALRVAPSS